MHMCAGIQMEIDIFANLINSCARRLPAHGCETLCRNYNHEHMQLLNSTVISQVLSGNGSVCHMLSKINQIWCLLSSHGCKALIEFAGDDSRCINRAILNDSVGE